MQNVLTSAHFLITAAVLVAAAGGIGLMAWTERRPRTTLTPSMIPTTLIMFLLGVVALFALVHLVNLLGVKTGY